MAYPRKHNDETRQRIRELNAAGYPDGDISRLLGGIPTASCVRQIRKRMGLPQHFKSRTEFRDVCPACGKPNGKYKPLCMSCWSKLPNGAKHALGIGVKWKPREVVEQQARQYVAEVAR